jgi:hypothetical protein
MAGSIHEQLVELLSQLGDRATAKKEARHIHAAMLALNRGYDIGRDVNGFYARPRRGKPAGPAKELRDLAASARKAKSGKISREDWMDKWVANHRPYWRLCRPFLLVPGTRSLDREKLLGFSASGVTILVPKPEAALPALEVGLELMKIAGGNKRQRKPDQQAHDLIAVVKNAYQVLTGKRAGRAVLLSGEPSRFLRLGHDIDRLFGTKIFPRTDSPRLEAESSKRTLRRPK